MRLFIDQRAFHLQGEGALAVRPGEFSIALRAMSSRKGWSSHVPKSGSSTQNPHRVEKGFEILSVHASPSHSLR